jgi:hypothetical protein
MDHLAHSNPGNPAAPELRPFLTQPFLLPLKPNQFLVFNSPARFRVLVAGRRFGKTYLALAEIMRLAVQPKRAIWYIGPNDGQSKRIVWERLKSLTRPLWAKRPNETELRIDLHSGTRITVSGAFNPAALRGDGLDLIVLDEYASMHPLAWSEVFRPALADRQGRALFIGTPQGRNHFYDQFEYAHNDPAWAAFQFTTADGGLVPPDELTQSARELDPQSYAQEFGAEFVSVSRHRVYYPFDRKIHVKPLLFEFRRPVVWSIDFNVNPMCMLLMQRADNDEVHVIDEIVLPNAHTAAACDAFLERIEVYHRMVPMSWRPMQIHVFGDASGNQKRTAAADTDWTIIKTHFFAKWVGTYHPTYRIQSSNPPVRDRVNCVNSRLRNTHGEPRLFVDPKCRELVKDLDLVAWSTDSTGAVTSEIDKSDRARTHCSDALGYFIAQAFPLKPLAGPQSSGRIL